jgi:hypothetical protein
LFNNRDFGLNKKYRTRIFVGDTVELTNIWALLEKQL